MILGTRYSNTISSRKNIHPAYS